MPARVEGQRAAVYGHPDAVPAEDVAVVAQAEIGIGCVRRRAVACRKAAKTQTGEQIITIGGGAFSLHIRVAGVPI